MEGWGGWGFQRMVTSLLSQISFIRLLKAGSVGWDWGEVNDTLTQGCITTVLDLIFIENFDVLINVDL